MNDALSVLMPVAILLGVGVVIRSTRLVPDGVIDGIRTLIVTVTLPAVLFLAFLRVEFTGDHVALVILTFGICVLLFAAGFALRRLAAPDHASFPYLMTGFEAGMLGIGLYATIYGIDQVSTFAIVDLGHELFIWTVFLVALIARRDGTRAPNTLAWAFFRSPVVIAIIAGLVANAVGLASLLEDGVVGRGLLGSIDMLASLTGPLILLVVGYGIALTRQQVVGAFRPVVVRIALIAPLVAIVPILIVGELLGLDRSYQGAMAILLVLPPPFIIPLYMDPGEEVESAYVTTMLTAYSVVSIVAVAAIVALVDSSVA